MTEAKPATDDEVARHFAHIAWVRSGQPDAVSFALNQTAELRARVKVLEEALRAFIAAHDFAGAESWDCTGETRQRFEHAASAAKLLLEERAALTPKDLSNA